MNSEIILFLNLATTCDHRNASAQLCVFNPLFPIFKIIGFGLEVDFYTILFGPEAGQCCDSGLEQETLQNAEPHWPQEVQFTPEPLCDLLADRELARAGHFRCF